MKKMEINKKFSEIEDLERRRNAIDKIIKLSYRELMEMKIKEASDNSKKSAKSSVTKKAAKKAAKKSVKKAAKKAP